MEKKKRNYKLRTKLVIAFAFVSLLVVGIISIASNIMLEGTFKEYILKKQSETSQNLAINISNQYIDGKWDNYNIETICDVAMQQGLLVKVYDANGNIVFDTSIHHADIAHKNLQKIGGQSPSKTEFLNDDYIEQKIVLEKDKKTIGYAVIGYFAPYYYNENEIDFLQTLNMISIMTAVISLFIAAILGSLLAVQISNPLTKIIHSAEEISRGNYKSKIKNNTNTQEISTMIDSFNNLTENLENQHTLRKRITGDLSHELRTPLALLQTHTEAMIDGVWQPTPKRLLGLKSEIVRINTMVGEIEKLNELDSENFQLDQKDFDLKKQIERIFINFEAQFADKGITFSIKGNSFSVYADKDKFMQVIINLMSNALKYTNEGGTLEVELLKSSSSFIIKIKDNGIGIPQEDLPYVFERFYRADRSRNRQTGGNGIGLAIVQSVVAAHDGTISIKSELNQGTEIEIVIPQ